MDGDHSNNTEENLIVLCVAHHDEAHTKRQLSKNLDTGALRDAKQKWTAIVQHRRLDSATLSGQLAVAGNGVLSVGVTWGYINHPRVAQLAKPEALLQQERAYFEYCRKRGIVDAKGVLLKPSNAPVGSSYLYNSVYDWYEHGDDQRLHKLYSSFVDQISRAATPVHLEPESWNRETVTNLVASGSFISFERSCYFKRISETWDNEHRRLRISSRAVAVECFIDTRNMFGTTSMTVSFSGHQTCAAFLQVKSLDISAKEVRLTCTPIALGVGFRT